MTSELLGVIIVGLNPQFMILLYCDTIGILNENKLLLLLVLIILTIEFIMVCLCCGEFVI